MKENKLQQKIYAMLKTTQHIFQSLAVSLKNILRYNLIIFYSFGKKKDVNIIDDFNDILSKLKKHYTDFDYKTSRLILDYNNGKRRTWIITTNDKVYFIRKVGNKIYSSSTNKTNLDFQIEHLDENYNKLYVNGIMTPITYDSYLSGSTSTFSDYLKKLKE